MQHRERQITSSHHGHLLTNTAVWSPDSRWLVYDTRSSLDGSIFDGQTIERVDVETGRVQQLFHSRGEARCGVATYHPRLDKVVFIRGPDLPTADWPYAAWNRRGVMVDCSRPGIGVNLDARNLAPGFTPGALRGGTHVHTFSPDGQLVASTYEDAVLQRLANSDQVTHGNLRGIAISLLGTPTQVPNSHPGNYDGSSFTVLATKLTDSPEPGTDEICRACEEGWIGNNGYTNSFGQRVSHAIAFQGTIAGSQGRPIVELFVLDLPNALSTLTQAGQSPLEGTATTRPTPPPAVKQRRLTRTEDRQFPGVAPPRHWLRSAPDGTWIAFLAADQSGLAQLHQVDTCSGEIRQLTHAHYPVTSSFSVHPDGTHIAYVADASIHVVEVVTGAARRLTEPTPASPPRPEACVFSPDGRKIAYMRTATSQLGQFNQLFIVDY